MTVAEDKGDVNGYKTTFSVTLNYARNNLYLEVKLCGQKKNT